MKASVKRIKKQYDKLIHEVATNEFYKVEMDNRVNCYKCRNCGHITKTIDRDPGVTPMFTGCEECNDGMAESSFYNDIAPDQEPTYEWYRPELKEVLKLHQGALDHIFNGGLLNRKIKKDEVKTN